MQIYLESPLPSLLITWISDSYISLFITQAGANERFSPQNSSLYTRDRSLQTLEKNFSAHLRKTEACFFTGKPTTQITECRDDSKSSLMEFCEDLDRFSHCLRTILRMYIFLQGRGWRLLSIYKKTRNLSAFHGALWFHSPPPLPSWVSPGKYV